MTTVQCDFCGVIEEYGASFIRRWRPHDKYLYRDYCPKCIEMAKQRLREEGYTKEDGYDV
jgi:hypothetical protein